MKILCLVLFSVERGIKIDRQSVLVTQVHISFCKIFTVLKSANSLGFHLKLAVIYNFKR